MEPRRKEDTGKPADFAGDDPMAIEIEARQPIKQLHDPGDGHQTEKQPEPGTVRGLAPRRSDFDGYLATH